LSNFLHTIFIIIIALYGKEIYYEAIIEEKLQVDVYLDHNSNCYSTRYHK